MGENISKQKKIKKRKKAFKSFYKEKHKVLSIKL